ncbi:MAG: RDD family protein [Paracoccaceae bacterium]
MFPVYTQAAGLPDPDMHAEFYMDVPLKRLLAFIVDSILIIVITVLLIPLTAFTALLYLGFLGLVVSFAYRTLTLASRSATPGMRLMAIEFRNHRGERFDLGTAFVHTLLFTVSMSMVLPQVISIILMLTTERRQGLSDMFMGTAAINRAALS